MLLEHIASLFGIKDKVIAAEASTETFAIDDLRIVPAYQNCVYAEVVRAKEIALHLHRSYGDDWLRHIPDVSCEEPAVMDELNRFFIFNMQLLKPFVHMTSDNQPAVFNGYHTICAAANSGDKSIRVRLGERHRKSSTELNLKPFSELIVYSSRDNPVKIPNTYFN